MSQEKQLAYTVRGTISEIKDIAYVGTFQKREFCLKVEDGKYPQEIKLEMTKDKVSILDAYEVGDEVDVDFNIRGNRAKSGSVYNNLTAWKITQIGRGGRPKPKETGMPKDWRPSAKHDEDEISF